MFDDFLELTKWVVSHLITWIALNCLIVGGWYIQQNLRLYLAEKVETPQQVAVNDGPSLDLSTLDDMGVKNMLKAYKKEVDEIAKAQKGMKKIG